MELLVLFLHAAGSKRNCSRKWANIDGLKLASAVVVVLWSFQGEDKEEEARVYNM